MSRLTAGLANMKPTPKKLTRAFILSQKGKYSPALLRQFWKAAKALCEQQESFNFNTYLALIPANAKLVELYMAWTGVIKKGNLVKQHHGNWSFHRWTWLKE